VRDKPAVFLLITVILAFGAVASVYADTLEVRYLEGMVSVRNQNVWVALDIGDTVDVDSTVQIGPQGYLELADGHTILRLSRPGTFGIERLLAGQPSRTADTVLTRVLSLLTSMSRVDTSRDLAVAGTRATGVEDVGALEWAGGASTPELIERGRQELAAGRIADAFELFDEAALYALEQEAPRADFYLGYALFLQGDMREALYYLTLHEPTREEDFYDEHAVVLAHTHLELSDPESAIGLLTSFLADGGDAHALRPTAHLLLGMAHRMAGNIASARNAFLRVVETAPDEPEASAAVELLSEL